MGTDEVAIFEAGTLAITDAVVMGAADTIVVVACVASATEALSRTSLTTLVVISATWHGVPAAAAIFFDFA